MTGWMAAAVVTLMIRMCFSVYTMLSESCPRMVIVGMGALRRQAELDGMPAINAKRVYRIMRQNALLLERNLLYRHRNGHIQAEWPREKAISDGALTVRVLL